MKAQKISPMDHTRSSWRRILIISFVLSVLNALLHGLLPSDGNPALAPSIIAQQGLLPVAYLLYGTIWFGLLGFIFLPLRPRLPGSNLVKGLTYGLFFCVLTFLQYIEPLPHVTSFGNELLWMLADGIPFLLLGAVMGLFLVEDDTSLEGDDADVRSPEGRAIAERSKRAGIQGLLSILIIPAVFLMGRLFSYIVLHIYTSFQSQPVNTLIYVLAVGLWASIMYRVLRPAVLGAAGSPLQASLFYGLGMFGLHMLLFSLAFALIVSTPLLPVGGLTIADLVSRTAVDAVSLTIGVFICEASLSTSTNAWRLPTR